MLKKAHNIYDDNFFDNQVHGSLLAAKEILKILYEFYKPVSVIDIGCGRGSWLAVAESLGSIYLKGIDGPWISKNDLISKNIDFTPMDLEQPIETKEKYDLCLSIEVAEHLHKKYATRFVKTLCNVSDIVIFSAAIKFQEGPNHINQQWQSYWVDLFGTNDFQCYDVFRNKIWNNDNIDWWFRQNVFLYINNSSSSIDIEYLKSFIKPIYDIVHPKNYEEKILSHANQSNDLTMEVCLYYFKQYIKNKIKNFI